MHSATTSRLSRVYVDAPLVVGEAITLPEAPSKHLGKVLRMTVGEQVLLFNGQGGQYLAELTAIDKRQVTARLISQQALENESPLSIILGQSVSRGERMDWVVQKAVELGVSTVVPLQTRRSTLRLNAQRWESKQRHWQQIAISACEQCGRGVVPPVQAISSYSEWAPEADLKLILDPLATQSLAQVLAGVTQPSSGHATIAIAIGPEGGFEQAEIEQAISQGFTPVWLGPRVLRTETAAVVVLGLLQMAWGDL